MMKVLTNRYSTRTKYRATLLFLLGSILFSCNPEKEKPIDLERIPSFRTTEDSRLFFKNVRGLYYDLQEEKDKPLQYRIEDRIQSDTTPQLHLCIVNDPNTSRAFVLLEPNTFFEEESFPIQVYSAEGTLQDTLIYKKGNVLQQFELSAEFYNGILKNDSLVVQKDGKSWPLLTKEEEREAFRITMVDFLRLINYWNKKPQKSPYGPSM
ncbi:hypothetical protein [Algivirga pacifica]|uniref:Lipoprotein n=1 Tax=Algivirga pacifica TaxID=1162670 RepID=A0ABP9DNF5_9BACT